MKDQGVFGVQPPLSPPDLSNSRPNDEKQPQTNQGNAQNGLSPEFQDILNQQNGQSGQNKPIPTPTIVQGGGNQPNQPSTEQIGGNNIQSPIDSDIAGGDFGLDVS